MKKAYINPAMEIVKIQGRSVLTSTSTISFGGTTEQNLGRNAEDFDWEDEE